VKKLNAFALMVLAFNAKNSKFSIIFSPQYVTDYGNISERTGFQ
jgi:hypothetical protein